MTTAAGSLDRCASRRRSPPRPGRRPAQACGVADRSWRLVRSRGYIGRGVPGRPRQPESRDARPVHASGLEIHEVADGLVVYQPDPECVHHLNSTAAIVFCLCAGENTVAEIGEEVALAYGLAQAP